MAIMVSCDFCGDDLASQSRTDYLNVPIGNKGDVTKQICRPCIGAIDAARGRTV